MSELRRAVDTLQNAASKGFEWENISGVLEKLVEEFEEVAEAIASGDEKHIREEVGDVLFAAANLARFLKLDADELLKEATAKFNHRFATFSNLLESNGKSLDRVSLLELLELWKQAKIKTGLT